jgi:hypothetical protein
MKDPDFKCGTCFHWVEALATGPVTIGEAKRGVCFGVPPTPFPVFDKAGNMKGAQNIRASTKEAERACALYIAPMPATNDKDIN